MHDFYHSWMITGGHTMFLFWILFAVVLVWLVFAYRDRAEKPGETPLEIAQKRYAAGEISRTELDEIKRNL
ncbi:SHOCT domain-containing protein [Vibrio hangzhouensis]|uniref:Putative membrane protein n=1 Tax=Vibrio hangzhouensis TaxID=462991 RepID=A0A1H5Y0D7_9VIBR|nr:SHOCT domain-containing protein [Vibrio hangzhouensis]MBY6197279.1 SHOCT domain-containing protein [Vibrio hangzhouensis]SEG17137.1 putative membrane protein [Vibrio hangzhouensis]